MPSTQLVYRCTYIAFWSILFVYYYLMSLDNFQILSFFLWIEVISKHHVFVDEPFFILMSSSFFSYMLSTFNKPPFQ